MPREGLIRMGFFLGVFTVIALVELVAPRRALTFDKTSRWAANLSIVALDTVLVRLLFPIFPVGLSLLAKERGWGVLNLFGLPSWMEVIIGVVALDLVIYLQHVLFHFLPILWRLHRMHHTDRDLDVTTGTRFHPLEIVLSTGIKLVAVALIGAPALAVLIFEVLLNAASQFNHGNIALPGTVDRWLRLIVVTPDMHRVHHSVIPRETNSNFGFAIPWWDRFCGTYRPAPEAGHAGMTIGLKEYRDPQQLNLWRLLLNPFL